MLVTINITELFSHREPWDCSNSQANLGPNCARLTWQCATECAEAYERWLESPLADAVEAVKADARETGAWDHEEIEGWSDIECLAYLVQCLASDMRLIGSDDNSFDDCHALYNTTDWESECGYPKAHFYKVKGSEALMAQWGE